MAVAVIARAIVLSGSADVSSARKTPHSRADGAADAGERRPIRSPGREWIALHQTPVGYLEFELDAKGTNAEADDQSDEFSRKLDILGRAEPAIEMIPSQSPLTAPSSTRTQRGRTP